MLFKNNIVPNILAVIPIMRGIHIQVYKSVFMPKIKSKTPMPVFFKSETPCKQPEIKNEIGERSSAKIIIIKIICLYPGEINITCSLSKAFKGVVVAKKKAIIVIMLV